MSTARPYWAIPLTALCTLVAAVGGALPAMVLLGRESVVAPVLSGAGVTALALLLVFLWRRYLLQRDWTGVGLTWRRSAVSQGLLGAVAGAAAVLATNVFSLATGAARFGDWSAYGETAGQVVVTIAIVLSVSILMQGLPEEVLWRGHLHDLLATTLSPRTVLLLTSVCFGVLHLVSQSGTEGAFERALYILMAVALGFAAGAGRLRTGAVWLAVGLHSGFHLGLRGLPIEPVDQVTWLLTLTVAMGAVGLLLLGRGGVRQLVTSVPATEGRPS
ncbi:CPBP family intramembrane metalloprotease [Natronosporangium hydrolyticum]|uniref:CPBP family intramembrane metalloprotease n=1 Tax=Natronosporangium hydrolyticum TaxID=2811111 RepID=A0A895YLB7_9ACTN|nr:CPBP family intramembrane glutamic endopeptidase [Natronosporangium hydrolyticum]QSB15466.1 CPBP family intramembrane metalloprotease [Natronosporangium hydrolyticum]